MGLLKGDIEKVPTGLQLEDYYSKIVQWHHANKNRIHEKMKPPETPYVRFYFELVNALLSPPSAKPEDIAYVSNEVMTGLMEWAYHESDSQGVKTAAYAQYILNNFFDGSLSKMQTMAKKSTLYSVRERYEKAMR